MADHFYATLGDMGKKVDVETIVKGTSTAGSTYIELRVPDGQSLSREQVREVCERFARMFEVAADISPLL